MRVLFAQADDAVDGDVPHVPPEHHMPTRHQAAHAAPKPETLTVERTLRHTDGTVCRYRLTFTPADALRCLADYARRSPHGRAMSGAGGVVVDYLGEVK